jgi:hypothetical protein
LTPITRGLFGIAGLVDVLIAGGLIAQAPRSVTTADHAGYVARMTAAGDPKNEANDLLLHASPSEQATMLAGVVRAGPEGEPCVGKSAFYQGNKDTKPHHAPGKRELKGISGDGGSAIWSVRCTNGKAYSVLMRPDGSGAVMDCAVYTSVGRHETECFRKF